MSAGPVEVFIPKLNIISRCVEQGGGIKKIWQEIKKEGNQNKKNKNAGADVLNTGKRAGGAEIEGKSRVGETSSGDLMGKNLLSRTKVGPSQVTN